MTRRLRMLREARVLPKLWLAAKSIDVVGG
jgi:hypothetical protein